MALFALVAGLAVSILTHTRESAAHALAEKPYSPLSDIAELKAFPHAAEWRVLYRMSQGDWHDRINDSIYGRGEKERRSTPHDRPEEVLIEHILAYLPADVPFEGMPEAKEQHRSTVMSLNQCLRLINLPEPRRKDVAAASLSRFFPDSADPDALWYKVSYFELKDGVRFVHLARIPFAELRPFMYRNMHPETQETAPSSTSTAELIETLESGEQVTPDKK
ncbi:MAG: hypothetical protein MJ051_03200 [Akkermansia sp.]|nr:hypothetical protein [Akkermansia sp.]